MKHGKKETEGKLACPKCDQKLGAFDLDGISCSCGTTVKPAYKILKNRVDVLRQDGEGSDEESDPDLQFGDSKKKKKKTKKQAASGKSNFSNFRNKDYSGAAKQTSDSDE